MEHLNLLWILGAWVFFGSYPAPFKHPSISKAGVDPFVLQCMKSTCVFLTSWIVLAWEPFYFTYWGFVGAALWVPAGLLFITSVKLTGVAFATPIANGCQVIVSFCWGAFYFGEPVKNAYLSVLAMAIMFVAMAGLSYAVNYEKMQQKQNPYIIQDGADEYVSAEGGKVIIVSDGTDGPDGADEYTPIVSKNLPTPVNKVNEKRNLILGVLCALLCGLFGGTQNVPLRWAPQEAHGSLYLISFGIGSVAIIAVLTTIYCIIRYFMGMGRPVANLKVSIFPGSIAGCLWSAGNVCNIYATLELGQTVGFPLVMCNMMVAGMWGVFFYNEAPRTSMKVLFLASCAVLLGGVTLLSLFG